MPVVVLAVSLAATAEPTAGRVSPVSRFALVEVRRAQTPRGERVQALSGTVVVRNGEALWELRSGTFPRSRATAVLLGERQTVLLAPSEGIAARASRDEFRALFGKPSGDRGPFSSEVRDLAVTSEDSRAGRPFQGQKTRRHALVIRFSLVTNRPGAVTRVKTQMAASIEVLDDPSAPGSPVDELTRLFDVPSEVQEALEPELARVKGFPVTVNVTSRSELETEAIGGASGRPDPPARPVSTTTETTRTVSDLTTRPEAKGDEALFVVPQSARLVGVERLVEPVAEVR